MDTEPLDTTKETVRMTFQSMLTKFREAAQDGEEQLAAFTRERVVEYLASIIPSSHTLWWFQKEDGPRAFEGTLDGRSAGCMLIPTHDSSNYVPEGNPEVADQLQEFNRAWAKIPTRVFQHAFGQHVRCHIYPDGRADVQPYQY
ncbi:MAG: hypothetical protein ACTHU0_33595 [Kofleriaceae bacterium]